MGCEINSLGKAGWQPSLVHRLLTPNKITKGEFGQKEPMPAIVDTGEMGNWIVILRHSSALEMLLPPTRSGTYCKGRSQLMSGRGQVGSDFASQIWLWKTVRKLPIRRVYIFIALGIQVVFLRAPDCSAEAILRDRGGRTTGWWRWWNYSLCKKLLVNEACIGVNCCPHINAGKQMSFNVHTRALHQRKAKEDKPVAQSKCQLVYNPFGNP